MYVCMCVCMYVCMCVCMYVLCIMYYVCMHVFILWSWIISSWYDCGFDSNKYYN